MATSGTPRKTTPRKLAASEARRDWADTLNRVIYRGERVALTRRGKVVAMIVPAEPPSESKAA